MMDQVPVKIWNDSKWIQQWLLTAHVCPALVMLTTRTRQYREPQNKSSEQMKIETCRPSQTHTLHTRTRTLRKTTSFELHYCFSGVLVLEYFAFPVNEVCYNCYGTCTGVCFEKLRLHLNSSTLYSSNVLSTSISNEYNYQVLVLGVRSTLYSSTIVLNSRTSKPTQQWYSYCNHGQFSFRHQFDKQILQRVLTYTISICIMSSRMNSCFSITSRKDIRYEDVLDENDHNRVTNGNKAALLQERLASLRALTYEILQDDWKYKKAGPSRKWSHLRIDQNQCEHQQTVKFQKYNWHIWTWMPAFEKSTYYLLYFSRHEGWVKQCVMQKLPSYKKTESLADISLVLVPSTPQSKVRFRVPRTKQVLTYSLALS